MSQQAWQRHSINSKSIVFGRATWLSMPQRWMRKLCSGWPFSCYAVEIDEKGIERVLRWTPDDTSTCIHNILSLHLYIWFFTAYQHPEWRKFAPFSWCSETWNQLSNPPHPPLRLSFCASLPPPMVLYGGVLKYGYHQKIHLFIIFHYKPSIWGTPIYGNPHITIKAHHDLNSVEPKRAVRRCFGPMALHQRHELGLSSSWPIATPKYSPDKQFTIENGPIEIVDFLINSMVDRSIVFC